MIAGPDDVDPDPLGGDLLGQARCRGCRRRPSSRRSRRTPPASRGGWRPRTPARSPRRPAVPGGHAPHRLAAAQHRAEHVDGQQPFDPLGGQLVDPRPGADDAGVRDQRRERPEGIGRGEGGQHVVLDRDVRPDGDGDAAVRLDRGGDLGGGGRVVAVGEAHRPPGLRRRIAPPPRRSPGFLRSPAARHGPRRRP